MDEPEDKSLLSRVVALMLCVPLFELSLFLGLALVLGGRQALQAWLTLPLAFHVIYLGVAAAVGLMSGMSGLAHLLGHLFLTNDEHERHLPTTLGAWGLIVSGTLVALVLR